MNEKHNDGACPFLDDAIEQLLRALMTDGSHHKQYDIEQALRLICGNDWVDREKSKRQWIDGIPS